MELKMSGFDLRQELIILSCPRTEERFWLKRPKLQANHLPPSSDWLRMSGAMLLPQHASS
jgi:hypothetical protein